MSTFKKLFGTRPDSVTYTALVNATSSNNLEQIYHLIGSSPNPLTQSEITRHNNKLLNIAAKSGYFEIFRFYVEEFKLTKKDVGSGFQSPLKLAAIYNHLPIVQYCMRRFSFSTWTLHHTYNNAKIAGNKEVADFLRPYCKGEMVIDRTGLENFMAIVQHEQSFYPPTGYQHVNHQLGFPVGPHLVP